MRGLALQFTKCSVKTNNIRFILSSSRRDETNLWPANTGIVEDITFYIEVFRVSAKTTTAYCNYLFFSSLLLKELTMPDIISVYSNFF